MKISMEMRHWQLHICIDDNKDEVVFYSVQKQRCPKVYTRPRYDLSPLIRRARRMSLGMMVIRLACRAQRFASSKSPTR